MVRNTCAGADQRFVPRKSAGGIIAALAFMSAGVHAAEWKVAPRLDLGESYTDNVTLAPSSSAKSDWITQVTPGISIEGTGSRLRLKADYALQNLIYANESSRNSFYHQLNASANATLVENTLFLDARGNIQQQATSLLAPISNNNLNPGNVTDVSSYSVSPYLLHKFGSTAVGELRFTRDAVNTQVGGLSDSSANKVDLKLNSGPSFYDLGWGLSYTHEKVDYDLRSDTDSKVLTGTASYRVLPKLRAIATVGHEKNNYLYSAGQEPKGAFWSAGLNWAPTTRTGMNASVGERFFGKTYTLDLNHRTAQTTWIANYSQSISSMRRDVQNPALNEIQQEVIAAFPGQFGRAPTDAEVAASTLLTAHARGVHFLVLSSDVYKSRQLLGSVAIKRGKSQITLAASHSVRESIETIVTTPSERLVKQYGLNANWAIQVSPRDTFNLGAELSRNVFPDLSRTDDTRSIRLGMTRKLEKKVSGSVDFLHSLRDSNLNENDYTQNAISGHLLWMF